MSSTSDIFTFLNYSNEIKKQEVEMWYRRHKLYSTISRPFYWWRAPLNMALSRSLLWTNKGEKLRTSIGHNGPSVSRDPDAKKKQWHSSILGHLFSYNSPRTLQHWQSANPSFNTDICCLINQTRWKNTILVHFIHSVLFTCTWVPMYCAPVTDMKEQAHCWQELWQRLVEYSSYFILPSDPPLESLPTLPSHNDIWIHWYMYRLILKWYFGSFRLKYCSDIAAISYKGRKAT